MTPEGTKGAAGLRGEAAEGITGARRRRAWALVAGGVVLAAMLGVSCFQGAELEDDYYACTSDESCEGTGLICFDGVCCSPRGEPLCLGYAFEDRSCADGGTARTFYADLDEDGFGDTQSARPFCAAPVSLRYVEEGGDCNDNPEASGQLAYPGRVGDPCDAVDNDCDGDFDEDASLRSTFYLDRDGDGHGEAALSVQACQAPFGYVSSADDCAPDDGAVYPGAPELCNGRSDDCDNQVDEEAVGTGVACPATAQGACAQGRYACVAAALVCSPGQPTRDRCDGQDNDCDGVVDERPDCGGPTSADVLAGVGVSIRPENPPANQTDGVQTVNVDNGQPPLRCFKDPGNLPETWAPSTRTWSGGGTGGHVLVIESTGVPWDLTKADGRFALEFAYSLGAGATAPNYWQDFAQPLVLFCSASGTQFNRYVHPGTSPRFMTPTATSGSVATAVPFLALAGGTEIDGWRLGIGSSVDLSAVQRIEIFIAVGGGNPPFSVTLSKAGFETP